MKNLMLFFVLTCFFSCKEDFSKEEYDVSLNFENVTTSKIKLSILEVNKQIKWENKEINPNQILNISFNIKKDIGISEGGFIFKAYFEGGDSTILNTGYFTNFQFQDKSPKYYTISKKGFATL